LAEEEPVNEEEKALRDPVSQTSLFAYRSLLDLPDPKAES